MVFGKGCVAMLDLTLRDATTGERLDGGMYDLLWGVGMPLAGLQRVIEGLDEGDPFDAVVPAAEAFGPDAPGKVMEVPRKSLGRDVLARSFVTVEVEGRHVPLFVERVEGRRAWVRLDHPFTGRDVRAEGTVIHVRHATFEEVEHGHVHGPGTHH